MYTSNLMSILDSDVDLDQDTKKFVLSYAGDNATQVKRKMQARTFVAINTALEVSSGWRVFSLLRASLTGCGQVSDASSRSPLINALVGKGAFLFSVFSLRG